jgi:serine/threonine protein kinase
VDPLLWQRVEQALHEALALDQPHRAEFVAALDDAEVRTEVASLLAADGAGLEQNLERVISTTALRIIDSEEPPSSQFGRYRLLDSLGSGSMSTVYLAEDPQLGKKVALKFLSAGFSGDESRVRRFEREARAVSALHHPNIVTIDEIGNIDERWFIAMEYVAGEPLSARISRGPIPVPDALRIAEQVCLALFEAHQHGIIHRDVKPANIMLRNDGVVKLVDFGVARLDPVVFEGGQTTYSGKLLGTPAYMSPEQARGLTLTAGSDLWSLGAVLYEMVTGTRAFRGSDSPELLAAILSRKPVKPSQKVPAIPAALDTLIMKLLSQTVSARYSSAQETCLAIRKIQSTLVSSPSEPWRWISSLFR